MLPFTLHLFFGGEGGIEEIKNTTLTNNSNLNESIIYFEIYLIKLRNKK